MVVAQVGEDNIWIAVLVEIAGGRSSCRRGGQRVKFCSE